MKITNSSRPATPPWYRRALSDGLDPGYCSWTLPMPRSGSAPVRSLVARSEPSSSKTTRWPWRSIRKIEPSRAPAARAYSDRSVSRTTVPSPVPGSYDLITPCIASPSASRPTMRPVPPHATPEALLSGEFAFLERLRLALPEPPPGQVGVGDDTAVLDGGLLFATDVLTEGVHFDLRWSTPADVGWKALAVNLSDIAAMGGA